MTDEEAYEAELFKDGIKEDCMLSLEEVENIILQSPFRPIGFACDEGVKRNNGRIGAASGPLTAIPYLAKRGIQLDPQRIVKHEVEKSDEPSNTFVEAQQRLTIKVYAHLFQYKYRTFVIGGGHETAFGHCRGLLKALPSTCSLGIINFDAHLDLRPLPADNVGTSGTPFTEIHKLCEMYNRVFDYTCIGLQRAATSDELYAKARETGTTIVHHDQLDKASRAIDSALSCDVIYLSICLDVFSAAVSPGVSAPQPLGVLPNELLPLIRRIKESGQLIAFDIVEYNPTYDDQNQITARLLADLASELFREREFV